jgi:YD repeat-containing protein
MKMSRVILWALGVCLMGSAWGRPVDLSAPSAQVGSAGLYGDLQLWREVDGVGLDMGKGSYLPLRFKFSSATDTGGMMGPGFYCPMFEARNILVREKLMEAFLPCGKRLYLRRDTMDPTRFQSPDQEWTGLLDGDDFVIWRDDGWKVTYRQNRLAEIQNDSNHTFEWSYNDQGVPTGVSEDGQPGIGVETDINGKLSGFTYQNKRYTVDFADRPAMEVVNGQTLVGKLVSAVSAFHYPDGKTETYRVLLAPPDLTPTLDFIDADKQETVYTWDAPTGHLASEKGPGGNWTYQVGEVTVADGVPTIARTNDQGQTEGMALDNTTGTYTATNLDGSTIITRTFRTPGPLYGKVHKVEKIVNGQTSTIYQASYDEMGKLIRIVDEQGIITKYIYDPSGHEVKRTVELSKDADLIKSLARQEKIRLKQIQQERNVGKYQEEIYSLALFYMHQMLAFDKANALISKVPNREVKYAIRLDVAISDRNLSVSQKNQLLRKLASDFPDKSNYTNNLLVNDENN